MSAPVAFYVSPGGDDQDTGTDATHPFKTIEKARDTIRRKKYNQNMQADLFVYLRGGRYELNHTLDFDAQDSGSQGHSVIYKAYQKEEPFICGGRRITGWRPVPGKPYFVADAPGPLVTVSSKDADQSSAYPYFPALYVNGVCGIRARSNDFHTGSRKEWWREPGSPAPTKGTDKSYMEVPGTGLGVRKADVKNYTNPEDIRLQWVNVFKSIDVPIAALVAAPDNPGEMIFKMNPGHMGFTRWLGPKKEFLIVNALEELDEPGEWYLDQKKHLVYDYPAVRDGDLNQAEVYAPCVEPLMRVNGDPANHAHHLRFDGITFQHGNWTGAKTQLLGFSQAEIGGPPGELVFNFVDDMAVTRCTLRHMAACGIQLDEGCFRILIEGNTTYDTVAAGILVGRCKGVDYPAGSICTDIMIRNNVVRDTGRDFAQGTGLSIMSVLRCKVYHNDISDTAYTALHARTGGKVKEFNPGIGKLEYKWNKVSNCFADSKWGIADGGEIYMHGPYPDSEVAGNYTLHSFPSANNDYYSDDHSHTTRWVGNVSRDTQAMKPYNAWFPENIGVAFDNNYSDKPNPDAGRGGKQTNFHLVTNNQWPPEAQRIMNNAGLEPAFQYLLKNIYGHDNLAEGKRCLSSSDIDKDHGASEATDNRWNSFWRASDSAQGASWWEVDLGKAYVIQKVAIIPRQDTYEPQARKMLEIQASNDPSFKSHVVLAERTELPWYNKHSTPARAQYPANNLWEQFVNIKQGYRYLRVQSTDPHGVLSMGEFFAYGYPAEAR